MVCAQLAHLGFGQIIAVDGDRVEASNVSRILGVHSGDNGKVHKTRRAVPARTARAGPRRHTGPP